MICRMWLNGDSFVDMKKETGVQISDIEDICNKLISYEFSFFIGNIIDVIDAADDEGIAILISKLLLLQRKLKYGVCSETAISICEKVFNDRLLANSIAGQIRVESIDTNHIIEALKTCKNSILKFLSVYPTYFSARINWLCRWPCYSYTYPYLWFLYIMQPKSIICWICKGATQKAINSRKAG